MSVSSSQHELQLAFYGDDFTGSTDALECLATAGLKTVLFVAPPTAEQLAKHGPLDALGIAGHSRSLPTESLEAEVGPALRRLRELAPRHVHYKVCSTFDSSPTVGSIGRVIDIAGEIFDAPLVPLVVGAPALSRWCVFGNLFARFGTGSDGEICRLDRHPAMRNHPTTPANESDLRLHLSAQTSKPIDLVDVLTLDQHCDEPSFLLQQQTQDENHIVLFDALTRQHLETIGAALDKYADSHSPLFSVGSSSIELALATHWTKRRSAPGMLANDRASATGPVLVVSGSCSPVTRNQIEHAEQHGFQSVTLNVEQLLDSGNSQAAIEEATAAATRLLSAGTHVIVHTGMVATLIPKTPQDADETAKTIGGALGQVLRQATAQTDIRRICIAGGDTSSYAARALQIESLTMVATLTRGAPLCRMTSANVQLDGLEVVFKGGQVGKPDFFLTLAGIS